MLVLNSAGHAECLQKKKNLESVVNSMEFLFYFSRIRFYLNSWALPLFSPYFCPPAKSRVLIRAFFCLLIKYLKTNTVHF